jgi:hypothetical protein
VFPIILAGLTDSETQIVIAEYIVFIGITILFSVLAFAERDKIELKITFNGISMVCWIMSGLFNLATVPVDNVLQVAPSVMFFGFALIFLILTIKSVLDAVTLANERKYEVSLF